MSVEVAMSDLNAAEVINQDRQHVWHHLTQHKTLEHTDPMVVVRGEGMRVWDAWDNEYLDAVSGAVWTVNVGYGRTEIADAVRDQLVCMNYFAQSAGNVPAAQFAERLLGKMPGMSRVYYSNSGSEANEKAFKMVRQIAEKKYGGNKRKILFRERDYHGTTIACLSATGQFERKNQYGPFVPEFVEVPHCCEYRSQWGEVDDYGIRAANEIERVILEQGPETIGALCLEPITAGGGVIEPPAGYWPRVQEICKQYDILLHIDEVVCGMGRTGTWFGYQHYGIEPDIVTMAKGLASGYAAISCTVTNDKVFNLVQDDDGDGRMDYFRDISTFGGCTAGPAAALANLEILERENLLENVQIQGVYLQEQLQRLMEKHPLMGDVRGKGLFAGFELVKDRVSKEPVDESVSAKVVGLCMQQGVIIGRTNRSFRDYNNTICLAPALIATREDIDVIIDAIDQALLRIGEEGIEPSITS
ncbi:aminotransferase class III-fold pyridoxal phosphate-dependent enzyme [Pseudomaricurvus alkylphenolicus]|nr:aminotransferase class III-fold pyridoxal phosphate-dependent enzyme [Pseudomaricurvus alkylphenolicus]